MHRYYRGISAIILTVAAVDGCVIVSSPAVDPYAAPDPSLPSVPLTFIRADGHLQRHESEALNRRYLGCRPNGEQNSRLMSLAWFGSSSVGAPVDVALPVGRSYFQYVKTINQESCTINFSAQLEAGHAYAIATKREYKGWLKGSNCLLGMFDVKTGLPVRLDYESSLPSHYAKCEPIAQH